MARIAAEWPPTLHKRRPRRWCPKRPASFWMTCRSVTFLLTFRPWHGIAVTAAHRGSIPTVGDRSLLWQVEYPDMKKRGPKTGSGGEKHLAALETSRFNDMLSLVEHCAIRLYEDGDPREPGWVTIKTQGAAWCVQVKDPDAAVSFTAVADTLDKALETASLLLSCDEAPWEPDTFLAAARARKKK